ncbi:calnexin independence factor cif1 [Gigaspora margarita]|uniref:Calnexin independence factor cif1 n=1 Tax=Gigaspora margarita TaxID=4874 RepID=A0A8H4ENW4_GIGMA|nr:calnexin independence factor cif1 [Gigaspora margarita]
MSRHNHYNKKLRLKKELKLKEEPKLEEEPRKLEKEPILSFQNIFFDPNRHRTQKATRGLCTKDKIYYIEKKWKSVPLCPLDSISTTNIKAIHEMSTIDLLVEILIREAKKNNNTLDLFEIPAEFLAIENGLGLKEEFKERNPPYIKKDHVLRLMHNLKTTEGLVGFRYIVKPECIVGKDNRTLLHLDLLENVDAINKATKAINHYYFHTLADPSHRSKSF